MKSQNSIPSKVEIKNATELSYEITKSVNSIDLTSKLANENVINKSNALQIIKTQEKNIKKNANRLLSYLDLK